MTATAAMGSFPYPHRTVAETDAERAERPRAIAPIVRSAVPLPPALIDLSRAPSVMERRFGGRT